MSALKFAPDGTPGEAVFAAFAGLNSDVSVELLVPLARLVLLVMSGAAEMDGPLQTFSDKSGVKPATARKFTTALLTFFRGALKANMTAPEVAADLVLLGLAAPKAQAVGELWGAEKGTLTKCAIESTLTVNQLLDMDWRFGVVASSKAMDRVGATFLQLKLVLEQRNNAARGTDTVNMELSLEQFYAFLGEMEKAYSALSAFV